MLERWNPTVKAFTVLICVILLSFEYLVSLTCWCWPSACCC